MNDDDHYLRREAARLMLVPELDVSDLSTAVEFYVTVCGFAVRYRREDEEFVYLERGRAELMLQSACAPGRRFRTAPLERPYGRGVNFQIEVVELQPIVERAAAAGAVVVAVPEDVWYRAGTVEVGNRQVVIADPDGCLLRFFQDLGSRDLAH